MKTWNFYNSKKFWFINMRDGKYFPCCYKNTPRSEMVPFFESNNYFKNKKLCCEGIKRLQLTIFTFKHF